MLREIEVCGVCDAGYSCRDCLGTGADRMDPNHSCMGCGGSGEEKPMLPSCSEERCGVSSPEPRP